MKIVECMQTLSLSYRNKDIIEGKKKRESWETTNLMVSKSEGFHGYKIIKPNQTISYNNKIVKRNVIFLQTIPYHTMKNYHPNKLLVYELCLRVVICYMGHKL